MSNPLDFDGKVSAMYREQLHQLEQELADAEWLVAADRIRKLKFIAKLTQEIERMEEKLLG
jgi:molecular chaperone HscB